ncbi:MAG: hypothetical protein HYW85_06300 [Deltaproteobacteria bacterium]|nr:hypothetical protein [Deltaproteobacteria bacterium]MBI3018177.1 hypothetical protein [Deltaproteobacteria bacterium]
MKTILFTFILVCLGISFSSYAGGAKNKTPQDTSAQEKNYAEGEVLVKFKPKTAKRYILALKQELKIKEETYTESIELYHWKGDFDTDSAIKKLKKSPHVLYAEPNFKVKIQQDN